MLAVTSIDSEELDSCHEDLPIAVNVGVLQTEPGLRQESSIGFYSSQPTHFIAVAELVEAVVKLLPPTEQFRVRGVNSIWQRIVDVRRKNPLRRHESEMQDLVAEANFAPGILCMLM